MKIKDQVKKNENINHGNEITTILKMGIDCDAILVFGWKVRTDKVHKWLKANNLDHIDSARDLIPAGIYLKETYPYNDVMDGDQVYAVSLIPYCYPPRRFTLNDLNELSSDAMVSIAKTFIRDVLKDKVRTHEPRIFALPHVY